jgi:hypothetical protein
MNVPTNRRTGIDAARLRTLSLGELLNADLPVRQYLLDPLMRQSESLMLWAAPGVGKTMAALSIAIAVAGGGKFLGWRSPRPQRVFYVDGEMHIEDLRDRLKVLLEAVEGIDREAVQKNLRILARSYQDPEVDFPDLGKTDGQQEIYSRARNYASELVILDNFSVLVSVDDENDATAMQPVLTFLLKMKQANIATLLVHHSNKGGGQYRGSSKIATTFEAIIGLKPAQGTASRYPTAFELEFSKYRGLRNETITATTAWLEPDSDSVLHWRSKESEDATLARLVDLVRSCDYPRQEDLAKEMNVATGTLSKLKNKAVAKGLIRSEDWARCMNAARAGAADTDAFEEESGVADEMSF